MLRRTSPLWAFALIFLSFCSADRPFSPTSPDTSVDAAALSAEISQRRHAVSRPSAASLSGRVTDASGGAAVFGASVSIGARSTTTDDNGNYEFGHLSLGPATVTVERWGYETTSQQIVIERGENSFDISVTASPAVVVILSTGEQVRLDKESVRFGYIIGFGQSHFLPSFEVCRSDGSRMTFDVDNLGSIVGPAVRVSSPACCTNGDVERARFQPKSGAAFNATFVDSCGLVPIKIVGKNYATGDARYVNASDIQRIDIP